MNGARLMLSPRVHPLVTKNAGKKKDAGGNTTVVTHTHVHAHGQTVHTHPHDHKPGQMDNHNHNS